MAMFQIKHCASGLVLFEIECDTFKLCVEAAVAAHANLAGANLADANLAGVCLVGANLADAYLVGANLSGADLSGANLSGAVLAHANLGGVRLVEADLSDADLSGACLTDANLAWACLAHANLAGAYLLGACLRNAIGVIDLGIPDGWRAVAYWHDGTLMLRVGCRTKTIAEARAYWADKDNRREVMAALDYAEAVAGARGWMEAV